MDYLPIFCRLDNKPVLLVGGGEVAERKARLLLDVGAQLTVVAPELDPELAELAANGSIEWLAGEFAPQQLTGKWLVVAATDRREVNALVYQSANLARIFANVVDDPKRSSFIMPSIIDRSPLMVAISSGGKAPVLARLLRENSKPCCPSIWAPLRPSPAACGSGSRPASPAWASDAASGNGCSGRTGSGRRWHGAIAPLPISWPTACLPTRARPVARWYWWGQAPAIRACSPCTPCARCSRRTWWSMTGWSPTR